MNAYLTHDRIEARLDLSAHAQIEREQWIDNRAQEIIDMFPKSPRLNHSLFLSDEACFALMGDKAQEAYNDFISTCAYARAEEEWQRKEPCPF